MRSITIIITIALIGAGVWFYQNSNDPESAADQGRPASAGARGPTLVVVMPVEFREIIESIESVGTTYANESVTITSKVTDTVNRVHFNDGDYVEAGKILVEMTNREESALLAEAQANLDEARRQLSRQEDLGLKGLTPTSSIDEALSKAEAAEARFNAITARMNDRLIQAPFSGILGFRNISPGTLLTSNTPITTLDDISVIKLDFSVPELYLGVMKPGLKIIALSDTWKDQEFEGIINSIGSRIDPVTRSVTVRAVINNDERLLRPGMLLTIKIIKEVINALVIPESSFFQIGDETFVYVAGTDGLAHRRLIKVGARRVGYVQVTEGIEEGELIVTEGNFKLNDKSPYRVDIKQQHFLELSGINRE